MRRGKPIEFDFCGGDERLQVPHGAHKVRELGQVVIARQGWASSCTGSQPDLAGDFEAVGAAHTIQDGVDAIAVDFASGWGRGVRDTSSR